jgi:hypothetical protein
MTAALRAVVCMAPGAQQLGVIGIEHDRETFGLFVELDSEEAPPLCSHRMPVNLDSFE